MVSLDTNNGYHQSRVRKCDQEKLTLFTTCEMKNTFKVILFGSKKAQAFYTATMKTLRKNRLYYLMRQEIELSSTPPLLL